MTDLLSISEGFQYHGYVLLVFVLALVAHVLSSRKRKDKLQDEEIEKHGLPPKGPEFTEFLPDGMKAENQLAAIAKYGDLFTLYSPIPALIPNMVVINEPELVKELCVRQTNMNRNPSSFTTRGDAFASVVRNVVGTGVTGLKGEEWRWRKTALLKEFHRNRLLNDDRGLLAVVVQEGLDLCEELGKAADSGEVVCVDHLTTKAAVGVVLFFLFGRRLEFDTALMRKAAKDMIDSLFEQLTNPIYGPTKYIPKTAAYKTEQKLKESQRIVDEVVATELDMLLEEYKSGSRHPDRTKGSVMESLIANEPRFREGGTEAMLAEARVFVQAGFETTAHSLAFSLGMMAERPDLARQMRMQGMESFEDKFFYDIQAMKAALETTPLVKNFFQESFRLYPLAPSLGGECTGDINITSKSGETYTLPKGTSMIFLNLPLQRQVPDPEEIRLERWDVPIKEQPFLHTFQSGPHVCPGKPLSLLEGRVFLLLVALQFDFEFPEGTTKVEYEDGGLLRPKDGMPLLVKRAVPL